MKKLILSLVVLVSISINSIDAQDTINTLFKLVRPQYLGLYVSPEIQMSQLAGTFTPMGGASAMLVINRKFALGAMAQRSMDNQYSPTGVSPLILKANFVGGKIEYTPNPSSALHISFPLIVGMGKARVDSLNANGLGRNHGKENDSLHTGFRNRGNNYSQFIVQPGILLEANVIKYVKLYIGASYRLSLATDLSETQSIPYTFPSNTLQGLSVQLGCKVGLFNYNLDNLHRKHHRKGKDKRDGRD